MVIYSKEQLEEMSIWQLRDYSRKLGHRAPASQRKELLVEFILDTYIKTRENEAVIEEPSEPIKRGRGRPPKKILVTYDTPLIPIERRVNCVAENIEIGGGLNLKDIMMQPREQAFTGSSGSTRTYSDTPKNSYENKDSRESKNYSENRNNNDNRRTNGYENRNNNVNNSADARNNNNNSYENRNNNSYENRNNNVNNSADARNNNNNSYENRNNNSYENRSNGYEGYEKPRQNNNQNANAISAEEIGVREGILEICPDGYGFLRAKNYEQGEGDAYIAVPKIRKAGLRRGDHVVANVKKIADNRPWNVQEIISINGMAPEKALSRPNFDSLTPIYPDNRLKLEIPNAKNDFAIRAIDLVAPIGKGQRAMIVSPPKAGKTTLLKKIAHSISVNYPQANLIVLLIDERPEEVTDMQRSIKGEVVFSTFDEMPEHHTKAAEMVLDRAKRLVEMGKDVVILMDSLTRLARAYNLVITPTGKTLSGGIDPGALHNPKRFFGAARNIEFGGSLTIIATALVDTGSRMDDVIYEEFKGTGNMEIHLDRKLSEKRIFPAIDLSRSGTRKEELLLDKKELEGIYAVRKMLSAGDSQEATESLIAMMMKTLNNQEFIQQLNLQINKLQKDGFSFNKYN